MNIIIVARYVLVKLEDKKLRSIQQICYNRAFWKETVLTVKDNLVFEAVIQTFVKD